VSYAKIKIISQEEIFMTHQNNINNGYTHIREVPTNSSLEITNLRPLNSRPSNIAPHPTVTPQRPQIPTPQPDPQSTSNTATQAENLIPTETTLSGVTPAKPATKPSTRKRSQQVILRVTPTEKENIDKKKSATKHKSYADFFIDTMSSKRYVTVTSLDAVLTELKHQGNNLNQQATVANATGSVHFENINATLREYIRAYRNLEKLANEVRYGNV